MVKCGSSNNDTVERRTVYHQEIKLPRYLLGVCAYYYHQGHYSFWVHLIPVETDKTRFEWTKLAWVYFQLLEGREVNDVGRAPIVY